MTITNLTWIKTDDKITVILPNGQPKTIVKGHANYDTVLQAIKDRNFDIIPDLLDIKSTIYNFSDGVFEVVDNIVHLQGKPVPEALSKKIIDFAKEGLPYKPLLNFWNKLQNNPSYHVVNSLFEFLDKNNYPITEDGDIIAYKGINKDWTDCYTGKILNTIGETISMPRNEVNDDPEVACSRGFHVANWGFSWSYGSGGHMIMVSVNPEDVVSMPNAYDFTKMRVCRYKVLSKVVEEMKGKFYKPSVDNSDTDDDNDDECHNCGCDICGCYNSENNITEECDCFNYSCDEYNSHHENCNCNSDDEECCFKDSFK